MPSKRKARPTRKNRIPELKVLSREDVGHYEPTLREVCISISDPGAQPAGLSPTFAAVLRLSFDDVVERGDPAETSSSPRSMPASFIASSMNGVTPIG